MDDNRPQGAYGQSPSSGTARARGSVRLASTRAPREASTPAARAPQAARNKQARRTNARREPFIVTLASAVVGAIGDRLNPSRPARRRGSSRDNQHLHTTFRSGSAAPSSSSLHATGAADGLRRAPARAGRGSSSVIGQPLGRSRYSSRAGGRSTGMALRRSGRGRPAAMAAPLRPGSILARAAVAGLVLFVLGSFVSKAPAGIAPASETPLFDLAELTPTAFPLSTPVDEWRKGEMPHLYQTDPQWATLPYGGGTVAKNACGPTALTMLYVYFTGNTDMDPGSMAQWADANNYAPTGATEWSFMTEGAAAFGFYGEMINPTRANIEGALREGSPVICVVDPGDFTDVGHYIVLKSIDDRAMVEVYDPNSPERSARKWDIVRIINQTDVAWRYSSL